MEIEEKISTLKNLFVGRKDVFAYGWDNGNGEGRLGYSPRKGEDGNCLALLDTDVERHLGGQEVLGTYPLIPGDLTKFAAVDFDNHDDKHDAFEDAKAFCRILGGNRIPYLLERSRSGRGCHVWIILNQPVPAWKLRKLLLMLLESEGPTKDCFRSFDGIYPRQDKLTGKEFGSLIALPMQGHSVPKGKTVFLNPHEDWNPYKDQWEFLSKVEKWDSKDLDSLLARFDIGTAVGQVVSKTPIEIVPLLKNLREGNRNNTFASLIGKLHHGGLSANDIQSLLIPHAEGSGFPLAELESEIRGICTRYPRISTSPSPLYKNGGMEQLSVVELAQREEPPPRLFLVESLIPQEFPTLLYGDGGQAKTFQAITLSMSVALGVPFAGLQTQKRNVLYLDYELDEETHLRRAYPVARGFELSRPPEGMFYLRASSPLETVLDQIIHIIEDKKIGFVVIDSIGLACGNEPESAKAAFDFFQAIRFLKTTVLCIDHQSKLQEGQKYGQKSPFGSAYKFNLSRSVIQSKVLRNKKGELLLKWTSKKNNFEYLADPIGLKLVFKENLIFTSRADIPPEAEGEETSNGDKIVSLLSQTGPATKAEIAEKICLKEGTVTNLLTRLKKDGVVHAPEKKGHAPVYQLFSDNGKQHDE